MLDLQFEVGNLSFRLVLSSKTAVLPYLSLPADKCMFAILLNLFFSWIRLRTFLFSKALN